MAKYKVADGRKLTVYLTAAGELAKNVKLDKDTGTPVDSKVSRQELEGGAEINLSDNDAEALIADKTILTAKDYDVLAAAKAAGLVTDNFTAKLMLPTSDDGSIAPRLPVLR